MFLRPSTLNALMKKAYKGTGLRLALDENGWLQIAGSYWKVNVMKEYVKKETLGHIVALAGALPEVGEKFMATPGGNQLELEGDAKIPSEQFEVGHWLTVTDMILFGDGGTAQRILQDEDTGQIYAVNNVFVDIVSNGMIAEERGEHAVERPMFSKTGILWKNNVCELMAYFRNDERSRGVMERINGIDLTPPMPENE